MRLVNAYTIRPNDIQTGDQMLFVIKAIVGHDGNIAIYRCGWDGDEDNIPQGTGLRLNDAAIRQIFPVLSWIADEI